MTSRENYISFLAINQKIIWKVYQALSTLLRASLVAQMVKNLPAMQETWVQSLDWEDPLENEMTTHSSILA